MKYISKYFIFTLLLFISCPSLSEEYVIDDYAFEWTALEKGKIQISLIKTEDTLNILIKKKGYSFSSDSLSIIPSEVPAIVELLKKSESYYKKQKSATKETSNQEVVKNFQAIYLTHPKLGFNVMLKEKESFSQGITIDRKEANWIAKSLGETIEMAKFIKKKVDF